MVTNRPIREGKLVTQSGLKRTQHRDLRAAIRRTQTRVEFEDRRIEENKKAAEAGLTTDDLLQLDRKRLKKETETCKFEEKGEKMRDPLERLFKPRRRTVKKAHQMRRKAKNLRNQQTQLSPPIKGRRDLRRRKEQRRRQHQHPTCLFHHGESPMTMITAAADSGKTNVHLLKNWTAQRIKGESYREQLQGLRPYTYRNSPTCRRRRSEATSPRHLP